MSDVILQAAIKANLAITNERLAASSTGTIKESFYTAPQTTGYPYTSAASGGTWNAQCPTLVADWQRVLKPLIQTGSTGLKVCDDSGNYRCNRGCSFTVPGGVTRVQFQLWGPGGSTSGQCCCGGSPFGPSGAWTAVRLNVSPGEVYCICSGCAYCCQASQTTPGLCGTPTYVCGPGLAVCADSGVSCYCHWGQDINALCLGDGGCGIPVPRPEGNICAPNSCSGWNFCWDSGNDDILVCHAFSRATFRYTTAATNRNLVCYGLNGLWPHMRIGSDLQTNSCSVAPPVFGFESCMCQEVWSSGGTCWGCYRSAGSGFMQIPGVGGYAGRVFGGCEANQSGDWGRMGMVCISYGGIT